MEDCENGYADVDVVAVVYAHAEVTPLLYAVTAYAKRGGRWLTTVKIHMLAAESECDPATPMVSFSQGPLYNQGPLGSPQHLWA